ncbi:hypothetical protein EDEG_01391 [Edhazardia aedis USNM 41457]|uniref:Uncharacterized protein n=1 Tax=Edhazardia aedis (strain USNM 41457) TaxID=1003232 RepID=J9DA21_EDHAE|nr:hypothetical protein EDEG_01391 [Edhazardia aedis USNM 41457]|eukprot:EJW04364.1 hypothetical protein EDEG_01391 [Edhazardia aedis USNM 41457]
MYFCSNIGQKPLKPCSKKSFQNKKVQIKASDGCLIFINAFKNCLTKGKIGFDIDYNNILRLKGFPMSDTGPTFYELFYSSCNDSPEQCFEIIKIDESNEQDKHDDKENLSDKSKNPRLKIEDLNKGNYKNEEKLIDSDEKNDENDDNLDLENITPDDKNNDEGDSEDKKNDEDENKNKNNSSNGGDRSDDDSYEKDEDKGPYNDPKTILFDGKNTPKQLKNKNSNFDRLESILDKKDENPLFDRQMDNYLRRHEFDNKHPKSMKNAHRNLKNKNNQKNKDEKQKDYDMRYVHKEIDDAHHFLAENEPNAITSRKHYIPECFVGYNTIEMFLNDPLPNLRKLKHKYCIHDRANIIGNIL